MKREFRDIGEATAAGVVFESGHDFVRQGMENFVARGVRLQAGLGACRTGNCGDAENISRRSASSSRSAAVTRPSRVAAALGFFVLAWALALAVQCRASLFPTNLFLNAFTGLPDTNAVKVFTLDPFVPVLANGQIQTHGGLPLSWNQTNGPLWLPQGNYFFTNSVLGKGLVFRAPDNSSNAPVLQSGFNTFVTVYQTNFVYTVTNGSSIGFATNAAAAAVATNAPDGNGIASLVQTTNAVAGGLNTATNSFDAKGLANTIGANVTNALNALGVASTNQSIVIGAAATNQSYVIGQAATNAINALGVASTNQSQVIGANVTNAINALGVAATNQSYVVGAAVTNQSYVIGLAATNAINALGVAATNQSYVIGANGTNYAAAQGAAALNASTNFTLAQGQALTNFTLYLAALNGRNTNFLMTVGPGTGNAAGTNIWSGSAYTNVNGLSYWTNTGSGPWTNYVSGIAAYQAGYIVGVPVTLINGSAPAPVNQFFTNSLAAGANVTLSQALGVTTISSTGGGGGVSSNALTAVVATNAPDGNIVSSLVQVTNAVAGGLNTATNSFDAKGAANTIGVNATNAINALGVAATNQTIVIGAAATNQSYVIGLAATNAINALGVAATNESFVMGAAGTNYTAPLYALALTNGMTTAVNMSNTFNFGYGAQLGYPFGSGFLAAQAIYWDKFGNFNIVSPGSFTLGAGVVGSGNFSGATQIPFTGLSAAAQTAVTNAAYGPLAGYVQTNQANPVKITNSLNLIGGNGGQLYNVTSLNVSNATVQINNGVSGVALTDSSGSAGAVNASGLRVIEGPSDALVPIQISSSNNSTLFSVNLDGTVNSSNVIVSGTITGNLAPATNLPYTGLSASAQLAVTNAAMAVGANGTNYANQVGNNLTNLFNSQALTFANAETNILIGTNPVAFIDTNHLILQGNGTAGANTIAPDFASYYIRLSATLYTNSANGLYFTNNGIQWLLNNPAGTTLTAFATIGNGTLGVNAAGTPPGGTTWWAAMKNNNYNGEIEAGNGAYWSNLNASALSTGRIPLSVANPAMVTNVSWWNPPFGNEPSLYSGGQNVGAKQWSHSGSSFTESTPVYSGSGEVLKGLNGAAGMNGEIRSNKRMPWFFINADTNTVGNLGTLTNWNESYVYTICSNYANSSFYSAITNAGGVPAYWFDSCWAAPHRTNGSFVMTVPRFTDSRLAIDTYIHTNYGLKVAYCYYYFPSPPTVYNTNNTEFDRAEYAGLQGYVGWPFGGSPDGDIMPGTATPFPIMTSDTAERDIWDLYSDAGDAVFIQDATQFRQSEGYEASRRRAISDAILSPRGRTPFIQGFTNQITFFNFESATTTIRLYKSNLPFVNSVTGDNGFNLLNTTPGQLVGIPDGYIRYAESSYGAMLPTDHMYLNDLCEGANFVGGSTYSQAQIKSYISQIAMAHCDFTISSNGRMDFGTADTNTFQVITNNGCLAVWCDKSQNWPKLVQDNGTNGCIRSEQLSDGSYVLNFVNTSNGIQTFSINLTNAVGFDASKTFSQFEVWTNTFIQTVAGNGSVSVTVPADDTRWYRFYPVGVVAWFPYNVCYKNATTFCDSQPIGLSGTNALIGRAFLMAAGSTFAQPILQDVGAKYGALTNFQITAYLFQTNVSPFTLSYWNYNFEAELNDNTYYLTQPNIVPPAFNYGWNTVTVTVQTPPGKKVQQITFDGGPSTPAYATNFWFTGYQVIAY